MKKLACAFLFLFAAAELLAAPDARDSVIVESKTVAPGAFPGYSSNPAAYFHLKVSITNKDTLANFTLPVEIRSLSGGAFIVVGYPRNFDGTALRLTSTLGGTLVFSPLLNSASPDSATWAGFWDPGDTSTAEPPNASRKAFWELKFDSVRPALGLVQIDSAVILDNRAGFVNLAGEAVEANFVRGIVTVDIPPICDLGCPHPFFPVEVLYGRPWSHTFDDCGQSGTWSVISGPGTINPTTGVYNFPGRCDTGYIQVGVRFSPTSGSPSQCGFTIQVKDNPPSSLAAQNVVTVSHGQMATNQINGSDPDSGDLALFSKISGPGTVNSSGVWSYPSSCADVAASPFTVRVKVSDAFDSCNPGPLADTAEFQLVVTNALPVVANCPSDVVPVDTGVLFSLQLSVTDADPADAGSLQFLLLSAPAGFSLSSSGLMQWTPSAAQAGLQSALLQVWDGCGVNRDCPINFAVSVRKGDLDADGVLGPSDVVFMLYCVLLDQPPPAGRFSCDFDCDGEATPVDFVLLLNAVFQDRPFPC